MSTKVKTLFSNITEALEHNFYYNVGIYKKLTNTKIYDNHATFK